MSNFAIHEKRETRRPSPHRGDVHKWILWPAFFAAIAGFAAVGGFGAALVSVGTNRDWLFIFGLGMFGLGSGTFITIIAKSFSFDKSPEIQTIERTPVAIQSAGKAQEISGNKQVHIPSSQPHVVERNGRKYTFTTEQMRHMADRYFGDNADFKITRDNKHGKKVFTDFQYVKEIMVDLGYWIVEKGNVFWTDAGGDWFESRMRLMVSPSPDRNGSHA